MCCGQKRAELRISPTARITQNLAPRTPNNVRPPTASTPSHAGIAHTNLNAPPVAAPAKTPQVPRATMAVGAQPTVELRYVEKSPIQVRGQVSGRIYQFSGSQPVRAVDARDVSSLLRTRFFRRA